MVNQELQTGSFSPYFYNGESNYMQMFSDKLMYLIDFTVLTSVVSFASYITITSIVKTLTGSS